MLHDSLRGEGGGGGGREERKEEGGEVFVNLLLSKCFDEC